jgi:hypothetical protein
MVWIILLIFFSFFLLWLLLVPLVIFVDTVSNRYCLTLPGIFRAMVVPSGELFQVKGWILFIPYRFNPFKMRRRKRKEKNTVRKKRKKFRVPKGGIGMAGDMIRTIRIRALDLNIDTDDFMLNAWLVPAFSFINTPNTRLRVNFEGDATLLLDMRIRLGALLWAFIRNRYKSFINH